MMICSDSQAAIRAIGAHSITSLLVLQCRDELERLPRQSGIRGSELPNEETVIHFVGPEHAVRFLLQSAKEKVNNWI